MKPSRRKRGTPGGGSTGSLWERIIDRLPTTGILILAVLFLLSDLFSQVLDDSKAKLLGEENRFLVAALLGGIIFVMVVLACWVVVRRENLNAKRMSEPARNSMVETLPEAYVETGDSALSQAARKPEVSALPEVACKPEVPALPEASSKIEDFGLTLKPPHHAISLDELLQKVNSTSRELKAVTERQRNWQAPTPSLDVFDAFANLRRVIREQSEPGN